MSSGVQYTGDDCMFQALAEIEAAHDDVLGTLYGCGDNTHRAQVAAEAVVTIREFLVDIEYIIRTDGDLPDRAARDFVRPPRTITSHNPHPAQAMHYYSSKRPVRPPAIRGPVSGPTSDPADPQATP